MMHFLKIAGSGVGEGEFFCETVNLLGCSPHRLTSQTDLSQQIHVVFHTFDVLGIWSYWPYFPISISTWLVMWSVLCRSPLFFPWPFFFLVPKLDWIDLGTEFHYNFFFKNSIRCVIEPMIPDWQVGVLATSL